MTTPQPEPIAPQEIPVIADRVARALVADMLAECRIYLGDLIDEGIGGDPDAKRLDAYTHGHVYGLVWDHLGRAAADYQRRDQVLTEAAEMLRQASVSPNETDGIYEAADLLLAARTQPAT